MIQMHTAKVWALKWGEKAFLIIAIYLQSQYLFTVLFTYLLLEPIQDSTNIIFIFECSNRHFDNPVKSFCCFIEFTLAIASMFADGSDPVESRHTKGILLSDSSSMASRSRTELSRYSAPRESKMYLRAWERVRSGHHARISRSLRKTSSAT